MRTFGILALTFSLAAAIAAPSYAQAPRGRGGFGGGFGGFGGAGYGLLTNKSVQQELKLEAAQAEKVAKIVTDINAKTREKFQDIPEDERREKAAELFRSAAEETKAAVKDELKPEQTARLEQIIRQQQGLQAFADRATAEKLQLTDDQKSKLRELSQETMEKSREAFTGSQDDRAAGMAKMRTIRKEALEKAVALLTDAQKKTWKELNGEPFEVQFEGRRGGRNN